MQTEEVPSLAREVQGLLAFAQRIGSQGLGATASVVAARGSMKGEEGLAQPPTSHRQTMLLTIRQRRSEDLVRMIILGHAGPSIIAAFLASLVEFVEALTVVLAVWTVRGWRPALAGSIAGALCSSCSCSCLDHSWVVSH